MIEDQPKRSANAYNPVIPYECYEKRAPCPLVTGYEMQYPRKLTEAEQFVADILQIIKEENAK